MTSSRIYPGRPSSSPALTARSLPPPALALALHRAVALFRRVSDLGPTPAYKIRGPRQPPPNAGLRREEVALLAGVSSDYYVRLEQGRDQHPSQQVFDGLARAPQLDNDATAHLHRRAGAARARGPRRCLRASCS